MKLIIFEDDNFGDLYPLTFLRPAFDLRCGILTLKEKVEKKFPGCKLYLETRDCLDKVTAEKYAEEIVNSHEAVRADDDILLVNAAAILTSAPSSYTKQEGVSVTEDGRFIWGFIKRETVQKLDSAAGIGMAQKAAESLPHQTVGDILIRFPWDLIHHNPEQITVDFRAYYKPERKSAPLRGAAMIGPTENIYIGKNVELQPHTWIDCRGGPVIIADNVRVNAHSSIHGPSFIGDGTQIFEAQIREGCSIGPICRVGGELEESIIHAYSNKHHAGFLGHSYVCEWVNLGALTTNSDLKSDYSTVSLYVNGKQRDSGTMRIGSFIGDHTKTSIGVLLNTGSMVGIMCNLLAGSSVLPKYVPSFAWYLQDRIGKGLGLNYAIETARKAMTRRKIELTDAMTELIRYTEEITREERMEKIKKNRKKIREKSH